MLRCSRLQVTETEPEGHAPGPGQGAWPVTRAGEHGMRQQVPERSAREQGRGQPACLSSGASELTPGSRGRASWDQVVGGQGHSHGHLTSVESWREGRES